MSEDYSDVPLSELFRLEGETHIATLTDLLLSLEKTTSPQTLESLMRAAHSLKGAARIVNFDPMVQLAHVLEDVLVGYQSNAANLTRAQADVLLSVVDILAQMIATPETDYHVWVSGEKKEVASTLISALQQLKNGKVVTAAATASPTVQPGLKPDPGPAPAKTQDSYLRLTAGNLTRIVGLASEALVQTRSLPEITKNLSLLRKQHSAILTLLERLREREVLQGRATQADSLLEEARQRGIAFNRSLLDIHGSLEHFSRNADKLSSRLYSEAVSARMRPFGDIIGTFPRFVRDTAHLLGKEAELEVIGSETNVDRDILEKLDAPIMHLLRNAIDHGLEFTEERLARGKEAQGRITISARHQGGRLLLEVQDDGGGIDIERVRAAVIARKLSSADIAAAFSPAEVLEFLFLPGFSLKQEITEISGRGVGLDVVQSEVKRLRGAVRIFTERGKGTTFQFSLPLTLSVVRALLVKIGGEPYAIPLARTGRVLKVPTAEVRTLEGREYIEQGSRRIGLVNAAQVLNLAEESPAVTELSIVLLSEGENTFGLVVESFLGHRELVLQPLDPRLGRVQDISAAAILQDGSPVLIIEVDDLIRSMELLITGGRLSRVHASTNAAFRQRKRVLVVDDSLTVRELERKLLQARGYEVAVAVDGMDGWNALRSHAFDLLITDIDMPRMDGIELVTLLKKDARLRDLPAMIVSYKDREEDRRRGLDAGADFYLTKGSFHDESLLTAVTQLIGEP